MISKIWATISDGLSTDYVKTRADMAENALALKLTQGDIEVLKAIAPIISALCNNETEGVSFVGLFLFYKIRKRDGKFIVFQKRLTLDEAAIINRQPTLLSDPYSLLENIQAGLAINYEDAQALRAIAAKGS